MRNRSTGKCPFDIVYTRSPRLTFDFTTLHSTVNISEEADQLVYRVQKLHFEVIDHLERQLLLTKHKQIFTNEISHFNQETLLWCTYAKTTYQKDLTTSLTTRRSGPLLACEV